MRATFNHNAIECPSGSMFAFASMVKNTPSCCLTLDCLAMAERRTGSQTAAI